jgi:uncharacterized membrane protein
LRLTPTKLVRIGRLEMFSDGAFAIIITSALIPFPTGVLAGAFATNNLDDQKSAILLYALIAFLMSVSWIPLFLYLRRNPATLKDAQAPNHFTIEIIRPAAGAVGYVLAALLGWFVQPIAAVVLFVLIVAYYAVTSTGVSAHLRRSSETPPGTAP